MVTRCEALLFVSSPLVCLPPVTKLHSFYSKQRQTPVQKKCLCAFCSCLVTCCTPVMHSTRIGESAAVRQCTVLTIMFFVFFFLGSVLDSSPELGAMVRIRSCLPGPSVNYSVVSHACRIRFPLCHLQAQVSDDQTAPMSAGTPDTPSICLSMWCTFKMLHRALLQ